MADKTMPERIRVLQNFSHIQITPLCERVEHDGTYSAVDAQDEQATGIEYVRADLVDGAPNERLELYQYRWIKIRALCDDGKREWLIALVDFDEDDYGNEVLCFYAIGGDVYWKNDVDVIGPVIRPPIEEDD